MSVVRRLLRTALAAVLLAPAGCANPPGTDGDLVNEWPAMAAPAGWKPGAGVCLGDIPSTMRRTTYLPLDCAQSHRYELFHVGQLDGEADQPPQKGSAAHRTVWARCDEEASRYLGGPWRERKIWMGVTLPSPQVWQGGGTWFGCAMGAIEQLRGAPMALSRSLRGAFDLPLLQFGCYQVSADGRYQAKKCDEPHNAEFTGVVSWNSSYAAMREEAAKEGDRIHQECQKTVAAFAGAPVRTGTWNWSADEFEWEAGDQSLRCYLYLNTTTVSKTLRGVGTAGWPLKD